MLGNELRMTWRSGSGGTEQLLPTPLHSFRTSSPYISSAPRPLPHHTLLFNLSQAGGLAVAGDYTIGHNKAVQSQFVLALTSNSACQQWHTGSEEAAWVPE